MAKLGSGAGFQACRNRKVAASEAKAANTSVSV